jgi:type IX secretion system PorP/SprF family membrane protein
MLKRTFIFIFILFTWIRLHGQTGTGQAKISLIYPVYSQYLQNGLLINPAYAGSRDVLSLFSSYRRQWEGIPGSPKSETISIHSLLKNDRVGLGLSGQFFQYASGTSNLTSVYADYAYHLRMGKGKLSLGLKAGFDMSKTDYSQLRLVNGNQADPAFKSEETYTLPNVGAGVYYYGTKFFLGAAVPQFLSYIASGGKPGFNSFTDFNVYISAGGLVTFSRAFKFKPSVFVDYPVQDGKNMRIDLNGNFIINDFLWLGGSWRTTEEVAVGIVQFQLNPQIMFGYSYDYPVGRMNTYSKGSHEIVLRYEFNYKVSAANPRYF